MQITYKNGGPTYHTTEYFPHLHYQAAATLANQNYDHLIKWGIVYQCLSDVEVESDGLDELVNSGAAEDISYLDLE